MTDLDARLARLVPTSAPPDVSDLEQRSSQRRARRRRRAGSIGVAVLLAGGVATWQVSDDDRPTVHVVTTEPTTAPSPTTITAEDEPIREPVIDHEVCERTTSAAWGFDGDPPTSEPVRIYAESVPPVAVQVIGHPDTFPDRYVVVLRVPNGEVQRQDWGARAEAGGVGHARTTLDDGTALYFRSRGVEQSELQTLVSTVVPRPVSSPIPGIDLTESTDTAALQVLAEEGGLSWVDGSTTSCRIQGGAEIHVSVWSGSMASVYAFALDAPPPILLRQQSDGTLLRMWGLPLRHHEDVGLDDVVDRGSD
jgi:hypothetical protein